MEVSIKKGWMFIMEEKTTIIDGNFVSEFYLEHSGAGGGRFCD
jgi:hypothetical protein